jgi:hypothetical protein
MPASFRPSRLVSSFKGRPVEDDKTKGSERCHLKFETSLLKYIGHISDRSQIIITNLRTLL